MANNNTWQVIQTAPFIGGLNTEINDLQDATQYTSSELNMVIKNNGTRARRLGIDYEEGYELSRYTVASPKDETAFSMSEWTSFKDGDTVPYIVVQAGRYLYFYKNEGAPFSKNQVFAPGTEDIYQLDLDRFNLNNGFDYTKEPVSFTEAYGGLFVCSKAIKPFYINTLEMDPDEDPTQIPAQAIIDISSQDHSNYLHGKRESDCGKKFYLNGLPIATSIVCGNHRTAPYPDETYTPLVDDFGNPITEGVISTDIYIGQSIRIAYMRTANYYARFWNNIDANDRHNITATAVTPYAGDYPTDAEIEQYGMHAKELLVFTCPDGPQYSGIDIKIENKSVIGYTQYFNGYGPIFRSYDKEVTTSQYLAPNVNVPLVINIRDFSGVADVWQNSVDLREGEGIGYRPGLPQNESDMTDAQKEFLKVHKYNLYNQGWAEPTVYNNTTMTALEAYLADPDNQYTDPDTQLPYVYYPANNYQWFLSKDPTTLDFKPSDLIKIAFGLTRAPTGKYILGYLEQDRSLASGIPDIPVVYPRTPYFSDIISYAGRIWYLSGDTILYSQVLMDDISKAGKCYQDADPTSEKISDIVDTDGGMIQIPELGEGIKFCLVGPALVVVGTRSIQLISGGQNNAFTATAYVRGAMQAYTSVAPRSFVTTEYGTFFWSDVGVVMLSYQGGFGAQNITESTINTFYQKIPDEAKKNCVGVYNKAQKQIVWMYPGDVHSHCLNKILVFDILKNAWTPFEVAADETLPWIVGGITLSLPYKANNIYPVYAVEENGDDVILTEISDDEGYRILADDPIEKEEQTFKSALFLCADFNNNSKITFGYFDNLNCLDWAAGDMYGPGVNYNSYLVSHPINLSSTAWNKTIPYLLTYFRRTEKGYTTDNVKIYPSACQGAILWDWNNSGRAGKWDAQQELYRYERDTLLDNDYVFSKTRIYGGGRAFQVKLSSKDNNYFIVENVGFNIYGDARI